MKGEKTLMHLSAVWGTFARISAQQKFPGLNKSVLLSTSVAVKYHLRKCKEGFRVTGNALNKSPYLCWSYFISSHRISAATLPSAISLYNFKY